MLPPLPLPMPPLSILSLESLPLSPLQCAAAAAVCTLFTLAFAAFSISIARRILPAVVVIQLAAKVLWSAPTIVSATACGGLLAALLAAAGLIMMLLLASAGGFDPMTMTFINSDSADMRSCAQAVSAAVSPAKYPSVVVSRVCSFYSGDSALAIASLPAVNATAPAFDNVSVGMISVQAFQYMMIGSAASVCWTLLWIGAVTTCVTGELHRVCFAVCCQDFSANHSSNSCNSGAVVLARGKRRRLRHSGHSRCFAQSIGCVAFAVVFYCILLEKQ